MNDNPVHGWCPPGGCPGWTPERVAHAVALAYERGRAYEREFLVEIEATWKPTARKTYEQMVAERLAAMDAANAAMARRGHGPAPLRFDDPDWPPVTVPGGNGLRYGPHGIHHDANHRTAA